MLSSSDDSRVAEWAGLVDADVPDTIPETVPDSDHA